MNLREEAELRALVAAAWNAVQDAKIPPSDEAPLLAILAETDGLLEAPCSIDSPNSQRYVGYWEFTATDGRRVRQCVVELPRLREVMARRRAALDALDALHESRREQRAQATRHIEELVEWWELRGLGAIDLCSMRTSALLRLMDELQQRRTVDELVELLRRTEPDYPIGESRAA